MINRTQLPVCKNHIEFHPPTIIKNKLSNSINLFFVSKRKLPIVTLTVIFNAGAKLDIDEKMGMAALMSSLIDEGAGEYTSLQLNEEITKLGSSINIACNKDFISISMLSLKENFSRTFELLSKIINAPHFLDINFEREKNKTLNHLLQIKKDADEIASRVFEKIVYGDKNFYSKDILGFPVTVNRIENSDILNFYNNWIHGNNFQILCVGDLEIDELSNELNKLLGHDIQPKKIPKAKSNEFKEKRIYIIDKHESVQTEIRLGHITGDRSEENYYSKLLLNTILGGQFSSRINLNLREKHGFTYGARSFFQYNQTGGFFGISTSVNVENTAKALKEILNELELIRIDITNEELDFAKASIVRKLPLHFETYQQIAMNVNSLITYNLPLTYYGSYIKRINEQSREDIIKTSREAIYPEHLQIVLVGDKNKIITSLKECNFREFVELDDEGNLI